ncbi:23S rRNA (pseudouridine(1915)-N(3))-methyltransferase RlmH [Streptococcus sp. SGI.013]|uniref:23S rRNA (pseudouridine(1915)-N(3))-methyltransferase RlmH n=1 Tax=unclassified Streptococcus TaxID=2608887 RepID=UPI003D09428A
MKVKLITVGRLKEKYLKLGIAEYAKRLSRFTKLEQIELLDEKISDTASDAEKQQILSKEGARILDKIGERDYIIVLAIEGKELDSKELSQKLLAATVQGYSTLTFIIGGSLGLDQRVKDCAHLQVSFGRMTLPHQLMKLVLIEQIYRSFMIQQGSPYHK